MFASRRRWPRSRARRCVARMSRRAPSRSPLRIRSRASRSRSVQVVLDAQLGADRDRPFERGDGGAVLAAQGGVPAHRRAGSSPAPSGRPPPRSRAAPPRRPEAPPIAGRPARPAGSRAPSERLRRRTHGVALEVGVCSCGGPGTRSVENGPAATSASAAGPGGTPGLAESTAPARTARRACCGQRVAEPEQRAHERLELGVHAADPPVPEHRADEPGRRRPRRRRPARRSAETQVVVLGVEDRDRRQLLPGAQQRLVPLGRARK